MIDWTERNARARAIVAERDARREEIGFTFTADEWDAAVDAFYDRLVRVVERDTRATTGSSYSPRAAARHGGHDGSGTASVWEVRFELDGIDVTPTALWLHADDAPSSFNRSAFDRPAYPGATRMETVIRFTTRKAFLDAIDSDLAGSRELWKDDFEYADRWNEATLAAAAPIMNLGKTLDKLGTM